MKEKKVLFISNQGLSPLYLGIELEIMEKLISEGHIIYFASCDRATTSCYFNPTGNPIGCAICQSRNSILHKNLNDNKVFHIGFPKVNIDEIVPHYDSNDSESIMDWSWEDVPFGRGVLSSVISLKRDYNVDQDFIKPLITEEMKVALYALTGFKTLFEKIKPDEVYVYNGRFSEVFPIVSFCKKNKVPFYTYEIGSSYRSYELFRNHLPHSIIARQENMFSIWDDQNEEKVRLSKKWYEDKVKGQNTDDKVYIKDQVKRLLPDNFDNNKVNIGIFNSSEDEMKTIEEWQHDLYTTQNEAIEKILKKFSGQNGYHFYVRNHPNLSHVNNSQTSELKNFNYENFTLVEAESPVDTYSLMQNCDIIICFGSTIGIEATYHGKISILLGKSFYSLLDAVYEPSSFDELFALISNARQLEPKPKGNTLSYGYYMACRGENYKYFDYKGKNGSSFSGIPIKRFYLKTVWFLIKYGWDIHAYIHKFRVLYGKKPSLGDLKKLKI